MVLIRAQKSQKQSNINILYRPTLNTPEHLNCELHLYPTVHGVLVRRAACRLFLRMRDAREHDFVHSALSHDCDCQSDCHDSPLTAHCHCALRRLRTAQTSARSSI